MAVKNKVVEDTDPDIDNIVGTGKIMKIRRFFSPEISLKTVSIPLIIPAATPVITPTVIHAVIPATESAETQGKEVLVEPVRTEAHKEVVPEVSKKKWKRY